MRPPMASQLMWCANHGPHAPPHAPPREASSWTNLWVTNLFPFVFLVFHVADSTHTKKSQSFCRCEPPTSGRHPSSLESDGPSSSLFPAHSSCQSGRPAAATAGAPPAAGAARPAARAPAGLSDELVVPHWRSTQSCSPSTCPRAAAEAGSKPSVEIWAKGATSWSGGSVGGKLEGGVEWRVRRVGRVGRQWHWSSWRLCQWLGGLGRTQRVRAYCSWWGRWGRWGRRGGGCWARWGVAGNNFSDHASVLRMQWLL